MKSISKRVLKFYTSKLYVPNKRFDFSYPLINRFLGKKSAISFRIISETGLFIPNIDKITIKAENTVEEDEDTKELIQEGRLGVIVEDAYNQQNKNGTMLVDTFDEDGRVSFYLESLGEKQIQPYLTEHPRDEQIASFTKNKTSENDLPKIHAITREEIINSYFSLTMVILSSLIVLGTILTLIANFI